MKIRSMQIILLGLVALSTAGRAGANEQAFQVDETYQPVERAEPEQPYELAEPPRVIDRVPRVEVVPSPAPCCGRIDHPPLERDPSQVDQPAIPQNSDPILNNGEGFSQPVAGSDGAGMVHAMSGGGCTLVQGFGQFAPGLESLLLLLPSVLFLKRKKRIQAQD